MTHQQIRALIDHAILIAGVIFMVGPLGFVIAASLSAGERSTAAYERLATQGLGFSSDVTIWSMLANSLIVALTLGVFKTLFAAIAAYALVYFRLRHAELIFFAVLLTLFLPLHARPIPTYLVSSQLGLSNSHAGLIIPVLASGLGVLLFRQVLRQLPAELAESARIDGAGPIRFLVDFVLPVSAPYLAALFAIHFIEGWHQFLWPLMINSDEALTTIMRGIALVGIGSPEGLALTVMALLPPLVVVMVLGPVMARSMHIDSANR
ncbi:ABC transporter permease subunit [Oricola sp.]|uniref:ABC transporter permease subunit n=1 Tax=Oricola sp. TaxID=1979950 RepID=UPI003BAC8E19